MSALMLRHFGHQSGPFLAPWSSRRSRTEPVPQTPQRGRVTDFCRRSSPRANSLGVIHPEDIHLQSEYLSRNGCIGLVLFRRQELGCSHARQSVGSIEYRPIPYALASVATGISISDSPTRARLMRTCHTSSPCSVRIRRTSARTSLTRIPLRRSARYS